MKRPVYLRWGPPPTAARDLGGRPWWNSFERGRAAATQTHPHIGGGQLLGHIPPTGAALQRELTIPVRALPAQPTPQRASRRRPNLPASHKAIVVDRGLLLMHVKPPAFVIGNSSRSRGHLTPSQRATEPWVSHKMSSLVSLSPRLIASPMPRQARFASRRSLLASPGPLPGRRCQRLRRS
jgi:hypothetical protein